MSSTDALRTVLAARQLLVSRAPFADVRDLLTDHYTIEDDHNLATLWSLYDAAESQDLPYWDVRASARVMSRLLQPRTYLEVGTRRGWSLAQVVDEVPDVTSYVFDMWVPNYGDTQQHGPDWVRQKMQTIAGTRGQPGIVTVDGNSHDTLPVYFHTAQTSNDPRLPLEFDMITVDGDHTLLGAWWDLIDLFPRVRVGGAMIFDDLEWGGDEQTGGCATSQFDREPAPQHVRTLMEIWQYMQILFPTFLFLTSPLTLRHAAGIAVRFA